MFNQALMYRKEGWRVSLSEKRKYRRLQNWPWLEGRLKKVDAERHK